jgi:hypothetical protein
VVIVLLTTFLLIVVPLTTLLPVWAVSLRISPLTARAVQTLIVQLAIVCERLAKVLVDICRPAHVPTLLTKVVHGAAVVTPIVLVFIPVVISVTAAREHLIV